MAGCSRTALGHHPIGLGEGCRQNSLGGSGFSESQRGVVLRLRRLDQQVEVVPQAAQFARSVLYGSPGGLVIVGVGTPPRGLRRHRGDLRVACVALKRIRETWPVVVRRTRGGRAQGGCMLCSCAGLLVQRCKVTVAGVPARPDRGGEISSAGIHAHSPYA
ncbi:hypothetical protein [Mycobacterium avium]